MFTALLTGLGVQGLQVEDLWSLEDDALAGLGQVKAFIFLFKVSRHHHIFFQGGLLRETGWI